MNLIRLKNIPCFGLMSFKSEVTNVRIGKNAFRNEVSAHKNWEKRQMGFHVFFFNSHTFPYIFFLFFFGQMLFSPFVTSFTVSFAAENDKNKSSLSDIKVSAGQNSSKPEISKAAQKTVSTASTVEKLSADAKSAEKTESAVKNVNSQTLPVETRKRRKVRVGYYLFPGYHNIDNQGRRSGFGYDYLQCLRRYTPWEYSYSKTFNRWSEMLPMLESGEIDLLTHVLKTPEREKKFAFSRRPIGQVSTIMTVHKGNTKFLQGDYKNWSGIRIGMIRNSEYNKDFTDFAKQKGFTWTPVYYDDNIQLFEDLQNDEEIDAALTSDLRKLYNESIYEEINVKSCYIAVNRSQKDLLKELDEGMLQLESQDPDLCRSLRSKYFSQVHRDKIAYTAEELAFINKCNEEGRTFTAVLNPARHPLSYFSDGQYKGIMKEIADEIVKRTGLKIVFRPLKSHAAYKKACLAPDVDIVFDSGISLQEAEDQHLVLSNPYFTTPISLLRRKDFKGLPEIIAIVEPSYMATYLREQIAHENVRICKSFKEAAEMVAQGKCDAAFLYARQAEYAVYEDPQGRLIADYLPGKIMKYSVGVRDTLNPSLVSLVNKSVCSIGDDFINRASMRHVTNMESPYTLERLFTLYPFYFIGVPSATFVLLCFFLFYYLRIKKNEYRTGIVFSSLPSLYIVADETGKVLLFNLGTKSSHQFSRMQTLDDISNTFVRDLVKEKMRKVCQTGVSDIATYTVQDGEYRSAMISRLPDSTFGRPSVIWISQDITDFQKVREEAKKNENFCRLTLESIGDGVIVTDCDGWIMMINPIAEGMIGIKSEEAIGLPHDQIFRIIDEDNGAPQRSPVLRTLRTGELSEIDNHTVLVAMDGKHQYHISHRVSPIRNDTGKVIGAILVFRDVSAEYKRRSELQGELARWEVATHMAKIYNFCLNTQNREVEGSKSLSDFWPIEHGTAGFAKDWVHPEDLDFWKSNYDAVCSGKKSETTFRYRVLEKNGNVRFFWTYLRADKDHPYEITGISQEITDIVNEQKKQNELQQLWTACINTVPAMIYIKSVKNGYRYQQCNTKFAEFFGKRVDEIIGQSDNDLLGVEEAKHFRERDQSVIENGHSMEFHEPVQGADGIIHEFRAIKSSVIDADGNTLLFGISLDVTEDHKLRMDLQSLVNKWDIASEISQIVTYRLNYKTLEITGSKHLSEFWKIKDGKALSASEWVYPPDVALCDKNHNAIITNQLPQTVFVYRVLKDDLLHYYRIFSQKNKDVPDEITGLIQDITQFVEAQKQRDAILIMWRKIVDSVPATFYVKDADDDFRYIQCNNNIFKLLNLTSEEVIGQTDAEMFEHTSDFKTIRQNDLNVMNSGKTQKFCELLYDNKGVIHRFESTKIPAKNEDGRNVLIGMTLEVTELQELLEIRKIISYAFEQLFSTEDLIEGIRIILKKSCEYIGFTRAYVSYIDEVNDSVQLFTYYVPEGEKLIFDNQTFMIDKVQSLSWFKILQSAKPGDTFDCDFSKMEDLKQAKLHIPGVLAKCQEFDVRGVHVNYITVGGKPWGSVGFITQHAPVKSLTKNELRLLDMIAHIIELVIFRKQIFEKLEIAVENAQAADKAKSFFLASMSHEIRTPLNAVIGFADLLKDNKLDPYTQQEYLSNISLAGNSLLQLINDILDLSKLEAGQVVFKPEKTNIVDFCLEITAMFSHSANQKNLKLTFEYEDVPVIYIDQQRIRQILFNLVGNAIKFTNSGGIKILVEYQNTSETEGTLSVSVKDTGSGVAPEDCNRLFEPFVQLTRMRGTNSTNNGTGLGLSIVKKMVTQMGGTVSLESTLGKGSIFSFVIPNVKREALSISRKTDLPIPDTKLCPPNEDPKILLVDDMPLNLKILASMLQRMNIYYKTADSGKKALELLKNADFNIVMTDLLMPEMDGEELAKAIRKIPEYASLRIVVITAEHDKSTYDHTLFDGIMEKPITRDALHEYIYGR